MGQNIYLSIYLSIKRLHVSICTFIYLTYASLNIMVIKTQESYVKIINVYIKKYIIYKTSKQINVVIIIQHNLDIGIMVP